MNFNFLIKKTLNECIEKFILNESLTSKVYHFCNIDAFWGICKNNAFILTSSNTNASDKRMSSVGNTLYPYYMCFSRTSFSNIGYQKQRLDSTSSWRNCLVRIEVDGEKLNYLYKAHPVNYFIDNNDSKIHAYDKGLNPNVDYKQIARQQMHEYEDRLLSKKSFIKNANYYIKRVDILITNKLLSHKSMIDRQKMFGDVFLKQKSIDSNKIFIYNNVDDFNRMSMDGALTKNTINNILMNRKKDIKTGYNNILSDSHISHIANALAIVTAWNSMDYDSHTEVINFLIDKYGFSKYKRTLLPKVEKLLKKLHTDCDFIRKSIGYIDQTKTNFKKGGLWKYAVLVDEMFNDYCTSLNINYKNIPPYLKSEYLLFYSETHKIKITPYYQSIIDNFIYPNRESNAYDNFLGCTNTKVEELKQM